MTVFIAHKRGLLRFVAYKLAINFFAVIPLARIKPKPRNKSSAEVKWRGPGKKTKD